MSNRARKCKQCGDKKKACEGVQTPISWFCSTKCGFEYSQALQQKMRDKQIAKQKKEKSELDKKDRAKHKERKKEVKPLKYWQDKLQKLVNQYVVHIRDAGKPCCTCGTDAPDIKYDAGHYRTRGSAPELRYELTNIHKQCSINCNVHGSGMRLEYQGFITHNYGEKHLEWLNGKHELLKVKFPHWSDYESEIKRYRDLVRSHGINPIV